MMDERRAKAHSQPARRESSTERRVAAPPRPRRTLARNSAPATPTVHSGGRPLDERTRTRMEARFDHDFSRVRVHHDADAARLADDAQARAFTTGQDIVFGPGEYAPDRPEGERLLAHELAHTVQQEGATACGDSSGGRVLEQQASQAADTVTRGERANVGPAGHAPAVQRDEKPGAPPTRDRTQTRGTMREFLEGQLARQGGKKLVVTPAVLLGLEAFFRSDPSARLSMSIYAQALLDQAVDLDGFAARIADFLPTEVPAAGAAGPRLDTSPPPGAPRPGVISKLASAAEKAAAAKPRAEDQEAQWRSDFEIGQARKAEGAKGPIAGLPGVILSPMIDPFMIARMIKLLKKTPAPVAETTDHASVEKLASALDQTLLVPAESKASGEGAGSWAEPSQVARTLGRELDLAQRKNNSTVNLRLGDNYRSARDRLAIIAELRKLVKQVRDALPTQPTRVEAVIIYFGAQQVQRIGLWSSN